MCDGVLSKDELGTLHDKPIMKITLLAGSGKGGLKLLDESVVLA